MKYKKIKTPSVEVYNSRFNYNQCFFLKWQKLETYKSKPR